MLPPKKIAFRPSIFFYKVTFSHLPVSASNQRETEKDVLHPKLEQTQPGSTSSAIVRGCCFPSLFG